MYTFMNVHNLDVLEEKRMCTKSSMGPVPEAPPKSNFLDVFTEFGTLVTTSNCVQRHHECATPKTSNFRMLLANVHFLQ